MGRPNCFVFPSHLFCPSSLTERTWKVENVLANVHLAAPPTGNPRIQGVGTPTHVLQQRLLPHGLHQTFGVHVAQAQDIEGAAVFVGEAGRAKRRDIISGVLVRRQAQTSPQRRLCQAVTQPAPPVHLFANALPAPKRG